MERTLRAPGFRHGPGAGYRPDEGQSNPLALLTFNSRWLETLDFTTGQKIELITSLGQLIIQLTT
ncbi:MULTISPECIES: type I toxin-antitoxin system SymE family toxin [Pantoea]|uniref:type I toxin-antitoxin system SymE family toxin n=1 Tax=Pantoea TaxID=53335 RepID=UPI00142D68FC|nr:type I toxin-antitoxin system SymE family toxin [Pantoea sp. EKM101V]KAF6668665.1 hypothetical protein HFD92_00080 [Pantoea sp. EKM101V]